MAWPLCPVRDMCCHDIRCSRHPKPTLMLSGLLGWSPTTAFDRATRCIHCLVHIMSKWDVRICIITRDIIVCNSMKLFFVTNIYDHKSSLESRNQDQQTLIQCMLDAFVHYQKIWSKFTVCCEFKFLNTSQFNITWHWKKSCPFQRSIVTCPFQCVAW